MRLLSVSTFHREVIFRWLYRLVHNIHGARYLLLKLEDSLLEILNLVSSLDYAFVFSFIPCSSNIFTAVNDMASLFPEVRFLPVIRYGCVAFSSAEAAFLLVSTKNRDPLPAPIFGACTKYSFRILSSSDLSGGPVRRVTSGNENGCVATLFI